LEAYQALHNTEEFCKIHYKNSDSNTSLWWDTFSQ